LQVGGEKWQKRWYQPVWLPGCHPRQIRALELAVGGTPEWWVPHAAPRNAHAAGAASSSGRVCDKHVSMPPKAKNQAAAKQKLIEVCCRRCCLVRAGWA